MALHSNTAGRVLITGQTGFTGRYVAESLRAIGLQPVGASEANPRFDLANPDEIASTISAVQPDYVIHLAAISFVAHADQVGFYQVNTVGTGHLLEALSALAQKPRKVILASSANIYGNVREGKIDESVEPQPANHYGCSKLSMEKIAAQYFDRLPVLITRPFNYTGVGQAPNFLIPKIVRHFAQRAPEIELGNLDVVRDFSDVRMVAEAYARLLLSDAHSAVVNICSGEGHSLRWILNACGKLTDHTPSVVVNPAFVRKDEVRVLIGSDAKLRSLVPLHAPFPLEETLQWMLASQRLAKS